MQRFALTADVNVNATIACRKYSKSLSVLTDYINKHEAMHIHGMVMHAY